MIKGKFSTFINNSNNNNKWAENVIVYLNIYIIYIYIYI